MRECLDVLFSAERTESQLGREVVSIFFLDDVPLSWIPEKPDYNAIIRLALHHGINEHDLFAPYRDNVILPLTISEVEQMIRRKKAYALFLSAKWYLVTGTHNTYLEGLCGANLGLLLHVLREEVLNVDQLDALKIEAFSFAETKLVPFIEEKILGRPLRDKIRDIVISHIEKDPLPLGMKCFLWGYGSCGWQKRTRTHLNGHLIPQWNSFSYIMREKGMIDLASQLAYLTDI